MDQQKLVRLLAKMQQSLQAQNLWQCDAPSNEKLSSKAPFALDSLLAHEWLQWIFIPKMNELLKKNAKLPTNLAITPYLEQYASLSDESMAIAKQIDELFI